jgi:hypothetical protein
VPTKRTFDLVVIASLLIQPALGIVRMAARRWVRESDGIMGTAGGAVKVGLGQ